MKSLHLILVLFAIASMFTSFGVYDVDATHNGNGKAMGCSNGEAKNNPHCDVTSQPSTELDSDGDGIPDSEDPCPNDNYTHTVNGKPDHDGDGIADFRDKTPCR